MHPLTELWPRLDPAVQAALATAHARYDRLSTGKAVRGLRGLGGVAGGVLDEMAHETKVPDPIDVDPSNRELPASPDTSPCIRNTAGTLLGTEGEVDAGRFLATLARVSVGSTASRWKRDGFDGERVAQMVEAQRA